MYYISLLLTHYLQHFIWNLQRTSENLQIERFRFSQHLVRVYLLERFEIFFSGHEVKAKLLPNIRNICYNKEMCTLVHFFNSRWRWCCNCFNFRQKPLEIDYQRSLSSQNCSHSLGIYFFSITFRLIETKHLLRKFS